MGDRHFARRFLASRRRCSRTARACQKSRAVRSGSAIARRACRNDPQARAGCRAVLRDPSPKWSRPGRVLAEHAAAAPGALPLLSFTLDELYKSAKARGETVLTHANYEALGGLEGAIANRADEIMRGLPAAAQAALPQVLRSLTTVSSTADQAPVARSAALASFAGGQSGAHSGRRLRGGPAARRRRRDWRVAKRAACARGADQSLAARTRSARSRSARLGNANSGRAAVRALEASSWTCSQASVVAQPRPRQCGRSRQTLGRRTRSGPARFHQAVKPTGAPGPELSSPPPRGCSRSWPAVRSMRNDLPSAPSRRRTASASRRCTRAKMRTARPSRPASRGRRPSAVKSVSWPSWRPASGCAAHGIPP